MKPSSRARAAGFTLLEVLVAVGIFALFSAMAYGSLLRILDTRDPLETGRRWDMQRVVSQLREGPLARLVWPALDQPVVSEPRAAPLLEHVEELRVRFYAQPGGWADSWPALNQTGVRP